MERSHSGKRQRLGEGEGEWQEVTTKSKKKERAKVVIGTADLAEFSDLAGPAEFWVGNTRSTTTKEKVEDVLKLCAEKLGVTDYMVEQVVCLTKEENPRTKSWKVAVPARLKETMTNPAMYPPGWSFRAFHAGPRRTESSARTTQGASPARETADSIV